ncbi:PSD1 and planctomycete cytochrome C domain-containing protein, partial [Acidobacteria bacterium AH-259-O06]|nr:PSD1 and planctomycete cytochrome C domain-containing protein [Acidobacteria bacterium AH-259-O06]
HKDAEGLFATKIYPLLKAKCFGCHGEDPKNLLAEFNMLTRQGLLKGGESGESAIVPAHPEESPLYISVTRENKDLQMPPKENDRLSQQQVEWVREWIAAGAPWPDLSQPVTRSDKWDKKYGVLVKTSGGLSPEWTNRKYKPEDLWAYQPIKKPLLPKVVGAKHPVDAFIQHKLKSKGFQPAPPVDKRTLIRRATFDLTGLPPTPEEVGAFLKDDSPDSFKKVVKRLLASPHYGERWGQHWLDVVRYADTSGFSNDYERPNAWRYRDYVIRSLNQDKPYNQFVIEQIAGDELDSKNPDNLIATGFLRMGPWEHTGMSVATVTRQQFLDDVTHAVGVTFLAQGLRCASCHDHKFDPIPTRDYYRMQAVFAPVQFADRRVSYQPYENISSFAFTKPRTERVLKEAQAEKQKFTDRSNAAIAARLKELGAKKWEDLPENLRPRRRFYGLDAQDRSMDKILTKRIAYYQREMKRYEPLAFSVYDGPLPNLAKYNRSPINHLPPKEQRRGEVQEVHILKGGALEAPGEPVQPGVLSAVNSLNLQIKQRQISKTTNGRRLALARWIASPQNPLTGRVIVNRSWQHHFAGKGVVGTPNDFGKMGTKPTHPELLDWLATWFIENGWSLKKLHYLIMSSATYQQSGSHLQMAKLSEADSNNELLAYYPTRRLTAEEIRDAMLAVTGELNHEMRGPGVYPEINHEVALQPRHIMGSIAPAYQPSPRSEQRNRRTIYAFRYRTLADPMLEVLNKPGSDISCARREETTVATQVFALFNSQFAHDRALALAHRLRKEHAHEGTQIDAAYRLLFGRLPSGKEKELCLKHYTRMISHHGEHKPVKAERPMSVQRHMVEEMTGEEFGWDEELDIMKHYVPDLKPWDVGPETRALAEVCLVLLNSNKFVYVR